MERIGPRQTEEATRSFDSGCLVARDLGPQTGPAANSLDQDSGKSLCFEKLCSLKKNIGQSTGKRSARISVEKPTVEDKQ